MNDVSSEIERLKQENHQIRGQIASYEAVLRQVLWFGDYSFYSDNLVFDRTSLTIQCPATVTSPYCSVFLYIPITSISIRVLKGQACFGFITLDQPIDLNRNLPYNQTHMLWYDSVYVADGRLISECSFNIAAGCVTARYRPADHVISFQLDDNEPEDAFGNISENKLFPIITMKKDTIVKIL